MPVIYAGFLVEHQNDNDGGGGEGPADAVGAVLSCSAALGGAAMLAFAQRLCEHSARYAAAQAAELSSCRSGCCSCHTKTIAPDTDDEAMEINIETKENE